MNRSVLVATLLGFIGGAVATAQNLDQREGSPSLEPHVAAPAHHRMRLDNHAVRVLEVVVPAGDEVPLHHHSLPSVFIAFSSARLRVSDEHGNVLREVWTGGDGPRSAAVHWLGPRPAPRSVVNTGDTAFHGFRIELKPRHDSR